MSMTLFFLTPTFVRNWKRSSSLVMFSNVCRIIIGSLNVEFIFSVVLVLFVNSFSLLNFVVKSLISFRFLSIMTSFSTMTSSFPVTLLKYNFFFLLRFENFAWHGLEWINANVLQVNRWKWKKGIKVRNFKENKCMEVGTFKSTKNVLVI